MVAGFLRLIVLDLRCHMRGMMVKIYTSLCSKDLVWGLSFLKFLADVNIEKRVVDFLCGVGTIKEHEDYEELI